MKPTTSYALAPNWLPGTYQTRTLDQSPARETSRTGVFWWIRPRFSQLA